MEDNFFNMSESDYKKTKKMLEESIRMYENTKRETMREMRNKLDDDGLKKYTQEDIDNQVALMQRAEDEQIAKYKMFGGDAEAFISSLNKGKKGLFSGLVDKLKPQKVNDVVKEKPVEKAVEPKKEVIVKKAKEPIVEAVKEVKVATDASFIPDSDKYNPGETFDVIPLPSNGECYKKYNGKKLEKAAVSYLTAYDENMIVSPNLYRDGIILDYLLKAKLKDFPINPDDMLDGDREAILLFLRASGYGLEYPVVATDGETKEKFETTIDLSKIKFKEFKLKGDENGYFDYTLPVSKKVVKFRFLTHKDKIELKKLDDIEKKSLAKFRLKSFVEDMDFYVEHDEEAKKEEKMAIRQAIREIDKWQDGMNDEDADIITHAITNKMKYNVVSIDGNYDREYIEDFIDTMPVKDAAALRAYIFDNEPGLDYNIAIEKPESLGGGSMSVFLQFNDYIFLNIANKV